MINVAGLLKEVIRTYKLEQPVPKEVRSYMHAVKRNVLVDVLRKSGNYGLYFGLLLRIYFLSRSMGIAISLAKCAAVFWLLMITGATCASAGAYAVTAYIQERDVNAQIEMLQKEQRRVEETGDRAIQDRGEETDTDDHGIGEKKSRIKPYASQRKAKPERMYGPDKKKKTQRALPREDASGDPEEESKAKNIPTL